MDKKTAKLNKNDLITSDFIETIQIEQNYIDPSKILTKEEQQEFAESCDAESSYNMMFTIQSGSTLMFIEDDLSLSFTNINPSYDEDIEEYEKYCKENIVKLKSKWIPFIKEYKDAISYLIVRENAITFANSLTYNDFINSFKTISPNYAENNFFTIPGLNLFLREKKHKYPLILFNYINIQDACILWNYKNNESNNTATDLLNITVKNRPSTYVITTDKVSNSTFNNLIENSIEIGVNVGTKKREVKTIVSVSFDDEGGRLQIYGRKELDEYDHSVHNAILSLALAGNEYITPTMIFSAMTGKSTSSIHLKNSQIALITNSVEKLRHNYLKINATDEAKAFNIDEFTYEGNLIQIEKVTVKLQGNVTEVYHLLNLPPLYNYAIRRNQVSKENITLLDTPINKTEKNIALQSILLKRISALKSKKSKMSNIIKFDYLFKELNIDTTSLSSSSLRKKKNELKSYSKTILDDWIEKGFIKSYEEVFENKASVGFKIIKF